MNLFLIDGNSYVYRAFYAIRGLTDSKGRPTNAIFGFTNMLLKILREKNPDGIVVSFDTPHPTERHALFEEYKANRPETPDEIIEQMPHIKRVVEALNIRVVEVPGYEADDVLATIARHGEARGRNVSIVTSDKDMLQLVGGNVRVYDPMGDRVLGEEYVRERYGVSPGRMTEYMALVGDPVDNIPGVKGVGDKTAKELLRQFRSIDDLLANTEGIRKARLRTLIEKGKDNILLSKKLAEINRDVPLDLAEEDYVRVEPDWKRLLAIFQEFEFTSLMKLVPREAGRHGEYETIFDAEIFAAILSSRGKKIAFDTETTGRNPLEASLVGYSVSVREGEAAYVPIAHAYDGVPRQMDRKAAIGALKGVLEDESVTKVGHNLKYDMLIMSGEGVQVRGPVFDTMVASYLLNPSRPDHSLEAVALEHLGRRKRPFREVAPHGRFQEVAIEEATSYAAEDAELAFELKKTLSGKLREEGLEEVCHSIEMPLVHVLADMEKTGIKIDREALEDLAHELDAELEAIRHRIYFLSGEEFNVNSPRQLATVLFDRIGLTPRKKKKTGYSTDMSVLEELAKEHELPREILRWRSLSKLKNTYVDVLPRLADPRTGRVHTSFNQTVTATGRLSSSEPNLQNIPIRTDLGKKIRRAFIAEEGHLILSADYSQIELRILAHLSEDQALREAFTNGEDVHTRTAAELFGCPEGSVTPEMRRVAKTVNFGVVYGISPFGLSESLGIGKSEAELFIASYFERHAGVSEYLSRVLEEGRRDGCVRTLFGRKRPIPELVSGNRNTRLLGERLAMNSPIQGTAADIIKIAMVKIFRRLLKGRFETKMMLQVHDELVFEVPEGERDEVQAMVREEMEGAAALAVPLLVDMGYGGNWADAH
jgi:DNA polymerase-1